MDGTGERSRPTFSNGLDHRVQEGIRHRGHNGRMPGGSEGDRDITVSQLRHAAHQMQTDFVDQMQDRLHNLLDGFVGEVTRMGELESPVKENPKGKREPLAQKVFVPRESLLTILLKDKNIQTIYNILVAMLIVIIMNTFTTDLLETGSIRLDFGLLQRAFGQAPIVLWTWFLMQIWAMLFFYCTFQYWAQHGSCYYTPLSLYIPDGVWLVVYITYQVIFLYVPMQAVLVHSLPFASSIIITTEQLRLLMKMHAFMRENAPKALAWKRQRISANKSSNGNSKVPREARSDDGDVDNSVANGNHTEQALTPCPDFSKYLYFLFCPSLIYRDSYPRTAHIRWDVVRINFLQVLGCLFYTFYLFDCFCIPLFKNFNEDLLSMKGLARAIFTCMLPATLMLLLAFFAILHSWFNAFAEMLRFADRQFYKDWWTCKNYSTYYRTWNIVVHDWLYTYIYRDCQLAGFGRLTSSLMVFAISAVFHEYIVVMAFRYFYPVLLVFFVGFGVPMSLLLTGEWKSAVWNIFMWITLISGMGIILVLYSLEWYARFSCDYDRDTWTHLLVPQSWGCKLL
ncbi:sterol O-acyltransferase 1-like [Lytechinus pictus]|uniref:sterol O-acyltransferase 1-like n=1 Tax=Lytechinus pictus TaxID=7653 RepID=UPI0030BA1869